MSNLVHSLEEVKPTTSVAFIKGTADVASHNQFQSIMKTVGAAEAKNIVLDLRQLEFITSLAVGEMITLNKGKKAGGGRVVIAGPNQYVAGVFAAARIHAVIPIYKTVEEAVAACDKPIVAHAH